MQPEKRRYPWVAGGVAGVLLAFALLLHLTAGSVVATTTGRLSTVHTAGDLPTDTPVPTDTPLAAAAAPAIPPPIPTTPPTPTPTIVPIPTVSVLVVGPTAVALRCDAPNAAASFTVTNTGTTPKAWNTLSSDVTEFTQPNSGSGGGDSSLAPGASQVAYTETTAPRGASGILQVYEDEPTGLGPLAATITITCI